MKISACIIAKNESLNIERCLESLKNAADEIIVADTGSTDDTIRIAESYGARVFHYEWDNNFSNAKNYALDRATGDWIIFLDADEYLEQTARTKLPQVLRLIHPVKAHNAVRCRMIQTDGYKGRVIGENPTIRIFRNDKSIRYAGAVHEQPLKNGEPLKAAFVKNMELIVYHTGYSAANLHNKFQRNLLLLEEQEKAGNIDHLTYYYLSSTHSNLGHAEPAIKYALLSLNEPKMKGTMVAHKPYVLLVKNMLALKEKYPMGEIQKYVEKALALYPEHPEVLYVDAIFKKAQNRCHEAIESYLKALECNSRYSLEMQNDFHVYVEEVYRDLASLSCKDGNTPNAVEYYYDALKINKYNGNTLASLYDLIKDQKTEEILLFLNIIYNREDKKDLTFLISCMNQLNTQAAMYYYNKYEKTFSQKTNLLS